MPPRRCYARFEGLSVTKARITVTAGREPDVAVLTLARKGGTFPKSGTLILGDDDNYISFADCRALELGISKDGQDIDTMIHYRTRLWTWARAGTVTGEYNRRDDAGIVIVATQMLLSQLLQECLDALGETNYDLDDVPDTISGEFARPYVAWDHTRADVALEALAEKYALLIVLTLAGKIKIAVLGEGDAPPHSGATVTSTSKRLPLKDPPAEITALMDRSYYQEEVVLVAVGLDTDGTIKDLDDNTLSYYQATYPLGYGEELKETGEEEQGNLWRKTGFQWFRLPDTVTIGGDSVDREDAILRLLPDLVDKETTADGDKRRARPYATGKYLTRRMLEDPDNETDASDDDRVKVAMSMDGKTGIVKFGQALYWKSGDDLTPPTITLHVAFMGPRVDALRTAISDTLDDGIAGQELLLPLPGVALEYINNALQDHTTVDAIAQAAVDAAEREYTDDVRVPWTITYDTIRPTELSGVVEQVTYIIDPGGPQTIVSMGTQHSVIVPPKRVTAWRALVAKATGAVAKRDAAAMAGGAGLIPSTDEFRIAGRSFRQYGRGVPPE